MLKLRRGGVILLLCMIRIMTLMAVRTLHFAQWGHVYNVYYMSAWCMLEGRVMGAEKYFQYNIFDLTE